jgi:O-antigen/teichoic acid export membrane protein
VALAQTVQAVLTALGLVCGALAGDALGALVGFAAGHILAAAWTLARVRRETQDAGVPVRWGLGPRARRALARYALPGFVAALVVSGALLGAQILLAEGPSGYADVAAFSVAYRWHLAIIFIPAAAAPALVPILTRQRRQDREQARRTLVATLTATTVIAVIPAAVVAAAAPLILQINGDFYAAHPLPLVILAIAAVPCALNSVASGAALSVGSVGAWLVSDLVLALALVSVAALLIPSLHASGLALAYLVAYVLTNVALVPALARHVRPSPVTVP